MEPKVVDAQKVEQVRKVIGDAWKSRCDEDLTDIGVMNLECFIGERGGWIVAALDFQASRIAALEAELEEVKAKQDAEE